MIRGVPYDHELEYIESTGSQWIDTGVSAGTGGFVITATLAFPASAIDNSHNNTILGAGRTDYAGTGVYIGTHNGKWMTLEPGVAFHDGSQATTDTVELRWEMTSGGVSTMSSPSGSFTTITVNSNYRFGSSAQWRSQNFTLFSYGYKSLGPSDINKVKFYSLRIEKGGVLVQHLIPVRTGNVAKMYDRVTGTFPKHYGTFVAGPVVSTPLMGVHMYQDNYTSYDYIQDSAFFILDGIENTGRGKHGNEFSGWHELTRGRAVFPRPLNSVWTPNGLRQDGVYNDYIGNNPGTYQSFVQDVDVAYPEIVTSRSNMVMTAEFVFEITGFTEAQHTTDGRQYFPFAGLGFLKYTEYNYSIWGIGQDGRIMINPAAAWNAGAYALRSTDTVDPIGKHCITLVLNGVDSATGKFKGAIYHNGVAMRLTQPTNSSTYAPFKHSDNTQPYTIRLNTATNAAWSFLGTTFANRLHARALTAEEVATNFKIDNSRYDIIGG